METRTRLPCYKVKNTVKNEFSLIFDFVFKERNKTFIKLYTNNMVFCCKKKMPSTNQNCSKTPQQKLLF